MSLGAERAGAVEMHQVRYFLALCETLNFTRAAERCRVSQPSLTRAIKLLEAELGGALFNRERNNTHLTELGRLVRPCLAEILAHAQSARACAGSLNGLRTVRLKLGLARGLAPGHLAGAIARFAQAHPVAEICLVEEAPDALRAALARGEIEVALLPDRPPEADELHYHAAGTDRAMLLVPIGHPAATAACASILHLAGETWIVRPDCPFFPTIEQRLAEHGITLGGRVEASPAALLPVLVQAGLGVAVTGRGCEVPTGVAARDIAELPTARAVYLATKRGRPYSPAVKCFVDLALRSARSGPAADAA